MDYAYDAQNRLQAVTDNRTTPGVTSYTCDNAGSLATVRCPNGVTLAYSYNDPNRLTTGPSRSRRDPAQLRLHAGSDGQPNGRCRARRLAGGLHLRRAPPLDGGDGDRGQRARLHRVYLRRRRKPSSTSGRTTYGYDDNDWLLSDICDASGNTIASAETTYTYDFENHVTGRNNGAVTLVYDGDGKIVGGVSTRYSRVTKSCPRTRSGVLGGATGARRS